MADDQGAPSAVLGRDPVMAVLLSRHPPAPIGRRPSFETLVRAVVSQQISTQAAAAILGRLRTRVDSLTPARLRRVRPATLRSCGLSGSKAACLNAAARWWGEGHHRRLQHLPDAEAVEHLSTIQGVGPWTARMVLLFGLGRPDVWPTGDAGIRQAARRLYRVRTPKGLERLGQRFRPFRSHAAWYLWRSLEGS